MERLILKFPHQFKEKPPIFFPFKKKRFEKIIICGVGGSALSGEILSTYLHLKKKKVPLFIWKNYSLPPYAQKKDLIIPISFSGNTEETISALEEARAKKIKTISISSDGKILKTCNFFKLSYIKIPKDGFPPRMATGYLLLALLKILDFLKIYPYPQKEIKFSAKRLKPEEKRDKGRKLARLIIGKIPLIYSSFRYFPLAKAWKVKFNENAKIPAFFNYFPELCHNEIESFKKLFPFIIFILKEKEERKIFKRMKIFKKFIGKKIKVEFISIEGKNPLLKIFSNLILADWTSFYLAKFLKRNPLKTILIERFKKEMNSPEWRNW